MLLEPFQGEGMITEVLNLVKSGKEANIYRCRAHPSLGVRFVAGKVYRDRDERSFKNDALYQEGHSLYRDPQARRVAAAIRAGNRAGRRARANVWADREFEALCTLADAGLPVPAPFACEGTALIMEYVGEGDRPAPQLASVGLEAGEARAAFEVVLGAVETALSLNLVHADLSPYNILWHRGRPVLIDFPQAVDPRFNHSARGLLERDLGNVCRYFTRYGVEADADRLVRRLWGRFVRGG